MPYGRTALVGGKAGDRRVAVVEDLEDRQQFGQRERILDALARLISHVSDLTPIFIFQWIITSFFYAFNAVFAGVGYYALRVEKEGPETNQIAEVFD